MSVWVLVSLEVNAHDRVLGTHRIPRVSAADPHRPDCPLIFEEPVTPEATLHQI